ncbi:hypothetical protein O181_004187 [Austropuccinia psidii MF-1]|uniref:Uncharacterized protein n=1 Tax=Austropuccinia psidii MF-1 TaxID=1389203 RepID=A0A9Q3GFJ3_9BASI|nr:hypothetical protein [Austropuccinia psidii MF-1]
MEDSRASTSSQRLASTFETILEIAEADIIAIPVVIPESFPTRNSGNIPVSVQELEALGPREARGPSDKLETHVLQRTSPKDEILVEKPKHFVRGSEETVGLKKGHNSSGSSSILNKFQTRASKPQRPIRRESKRKSERQSPSEKNLTHRATELQST